MSFKLCNFLAVFCAVIILAVGIAASVANWYSFTENLQYSTAVSGTPSAGQAASIITYQSRAYYWTTSGKTTVSQPAGKPSTTSFASYDSNSNNVNQQFQLVQAFILIALLLAGVLAFFLIICFADVVRNKLLFALGMNVLRVALLVVAILILVSLIIAFLSFLGLTAALSNDIPNCKDGYCTRFADSVKTTSATSSTFVGPNGQSVTAPTITSQSWGPVEGWFLNVGMVPFAVFLAIIVVINKFPIPVDSMTIGEAL